MTPKRLHIIPSHTIDAAKWNACIVNSKESMIYAKYEYLQHLADNWLGIVINDYEAVMPVIWRRKWGIRYAYTAPFIQQSGMFGNYTSDDLKDAINYVVKHIRYGDLYFNRSNDLHNILPETTAATNLVIPLQNGYDIITKSYSSHLQMKLKRAAKQSIEYLISDDVVLAVKMYQELYAQRLPAITPAIYKRFALLAVQLFKQEQCFIRQVKDTQNNLLAAAVFLKDESRIYNIMPSVNDEGKKMAAMHFLMDNVLQEFAGTDYIFDFEGSDVPGIKTFYESFGAVNQPYTYFHFNHLPLPLKWLKR